MAEHTQNINTSPQIFAFDDQMVRTVERDGEYWFVAKDVALALDYRNAPDMTRNLDEDEKGTQIVRTLGGEQELTIINESGLYSAILSSRKEEAKRFKRWITHEVLPALRKTGEYSMGNRPAAQPNLVSLQQQSLRLIKELKQENNKVLRRLLYAQLEDVCSKMGLETPALREMGADSPEEPPVVARFWAAYTALEELDIELNHLHSHRVIAVNLKHILQLAEDNGIDMPPRRELLRTLSLSQNPRFLAGNQSINSVIRNRTAKCWLFERVILDGEV